MADFSTVRDLSEPFAVETFDEPFNYEFQYDSDEYHKDITRLIGIEGNFDRSVVLMKYDFLLEFDVERDLSSQVFAFDSYTDAVLFYAPKINLQSFCESVKSTSEIIIKIGQNLTEDDDFYFSTKMESEIVNTDFVTSTESSCLFLRAIYNTYNSTYLEKEIENNVQY